MKPTATDFASALQDMSLTSTEYSLLRFHYRSPKHAVTSTELAEMMGGIGYPAANVHYGRLVHRLNDKLGLEHRFDVILSNALPREDNGELDLVMAPELVEAIETIGLFEEPEVGSEQPNAVIKLQRSARQLIAPGLAGIPVVGGTLSAAWSQYDTGQRFKRVEETIALLGEKLGNYMKSHEIPVATSDMELLEAAIERVQAESNQRKRRMFAELIATSWTTQHALPYTERRLFIDALTAFTDVHIKILGLLASAIGTVDYDSLRTATEVDDAIEQDSILIPALDCVVSRFGFVRRAWGLDDSSSKGHLMSSRNLSPEGMARKCKHALTPLGVRFLEGLGSEFQ